MMLMLTVLEITTFYNIDFISHMSRFSVTYVAKNDCNHHVTSASFTIQAWGRRLQKSLSENF